MESKEIHIIENLKNNCKIFKEETKNKTAKDSMEGKEVGMPGKDAQKSVKGKLEEAFSQIQPIRPPILHSLKIQTMKKEQMTKTKLSTSQLIRERTMEQQIIAVPEVET